MSICQDKNILSMYVDNELTESEKSSFEKHLQECEACSKQVSQYNSLRNDLQSIEFEYDNDAGYKRLMARKSYKSHIAPYGSNRDPYFISRLTPFLAAAAILAVLFPLLNVFSDKTDTTQHTASLDASLTSGNFFPTVNSVQIAPIQEKGIVVEEPIVQARISSRSAFLRTLTFDGAKLTEFDVFKPSELSNKPIDIILFDSPATVLHETDHFGFSNPVFLLRE